MYLFMFLDQFLFELSCENTHTQKNATIKIQQEVSAVGGHLNDLTPGHRYLFNSFSPYSIGMNYRLGMQ